MTVELIVTHANPIVTLSYPQLFKSIVQRHILKELLLYVENVILFQLEESCFPVLYLRLYSLLPID